MAKSLVLRDSAGLRYFTFFYLYVMQGIPSGFALTAVYNYLVGSGLTAKSVGTFAVFEMDESIHNCAAA